MSGPEKGRFSTKVQSELGAFSADSASKLDVLGHDGDSLGMDGAQVGVFEKSDQVGLGGFLKKNDKKK